MITKKVLGKLSDRAQSFLLTEQFGNANTHPHGKAGYWISKSSESFLV